MANLTFDRDRGVLVLFGGRATPNGPPLTDTWEYSAQPGNWIERSPPQSPASDGSLVFDSLRNVSVLYDGSQLWEWDGVAGTWTARGVVGGPSPRYRPALAFDSVRGRLVLFGGSSTFRDTWEWDGATNAWTMAQPAPAPAGSSGAMAYDSSRRVAVFVDFQGRRTWEWHGNAGTWTGRMSTPPWSSGAVFFDAMRDKVLFASSSSDEATWEYDGVSGGWKAVDRPSQQIAIRPKGSMAFDTDRQVAVLFGGEPVGPYLGTDTVEWSSATSTWSVRPTGSAPAPRIYHGMAFDASRRTVVLFGGWGGFVFGGGFFNDTWEFDTVAGTWTRRTPPVSPSSRHEIPLGYDPIRQKVVLFGGVGLNDTWEWDGNAGTWTRRFPLNSPPAMSGHSMTFNHLTGRMFISKYLTRPWEWDGVSGEWVTFPLPCCTNNCCSFTGKCAFDPVQGVVSGGSSAWVPSETLWFGLGALPPDTLDQDTWSLAFASSRSSVLLFNRSDGSVSQAVYPSLPLMASPSPPRATTAGFGAELSIVAARLATDPDPVAIQWMHDGVPLVDDGRIRGSQTPHLTISPTVENDRGTYRVTAGNRCGAWGFDLNLIVRCQGDWNGDSQPTAADVTSFVNAWSAALATPPGSTPLRDCDCTGDGLLTPADVCCFIQQWLAALGQGDC